MSPQINTGLLQRLEQIAQEQGRDVNSVMQEMIDEYNARHNQAHFKAKVRSIMSKHADLLATLAKY